MIAVLPAQSKPGCLCGSRGGSDVTRQHPLSRAVCQDAVGHGLQLFFALFGEGRECGEVACEWSHSSATPWECSPLSKTSFFSKEFQSNNSQFCDIPCATIDSIFNRYSTTPPTILLFLKSFGLSDLNFFHPRLQRSCCIRYIWR